MDQVGILGCGWLGTPLASALIARGWPVRVSRTSVQGVADLQAKGFDSFQILVTPNAIQGTLDFFNSLDQLIISLPPNRKAAVGFSEKIKKVVQFLESNTTCRILFLSSISVYGQTGVFEESSDVFPETESARELVKSEKILLKAREKVVIVRLGGLIGEDRNPIFQFQEKPISNPKGIINFIHQKDAIEGIIQLLNHSALQGIYNLVSPHHPEREVYYRAMAKKYKLADPQFQGQDQIQKRWVNASKIQKLTDFEYQVDNLLI